MKIKNFLLLLFILVFRMIPVSAQDDCNCPQVYEPVCAVNEDSIFVEFPNDCFAACFGFTVVSDSTLCQWNDPWEDCNCPEIYEPVCAFDSTGYYAEFPNACYAECFGFTVVEDPTLCEFQDPWEDCLCPQVYEPVCAVDSSGQHYIEFQNACYAECFGYIIVTDSTLCQWSDPWDDCVCTEIYDPVCAIDSTGNYYFEFPNACYAECFGYTIVTDSTLCGITDPWGDCGCPMPDSTLVCAQDSFGNIFPFPSECLAICWGFTVVEDGDCYDDPWSDCECTIDENEPFICAVDSLGHACYVPNVCFAACLNLTIVDDSICHDYEIDPEIDLEIVACIDSLEMDENTSFQEGLLLISQHCGIELPECITDAPLLENDSLFITYIIENCDGILGLNGNTEGSNVMNLYNRITGSAVSSTKPVGEINPFSITLLANPISEMLSYRINSTIASGVIITLTNTQGNVVDVRKTDLAPGSNVTNTDITHLSSGIYFLSVKNNQSVQTVKVVVTK